MNSDSNEQHQETNMSDKTTHFGFRQVPEGEKARMVKSVFDSVAGKYDLMNDLMSMGIHRIWKRIALQLSNVRYGEKVLDLAGGTGDMTSLFRERVGDNGRVVLSDINAEMLKRGRDRLIDDGIASGVNYAQIDAEKLPFPDNTFDCVCIAFGLRNVTHKEEALKSMYRVLKPGGRVIILEFSEVKGSLLKKTYDLYSFKLLPFMGKLVANDAESYQYLAESIRMHPNQETLKGMMLDAGFQKCEYFNLTHGVVAIHRGYKI
jgi:demethylmenaquinone methyltransferase/2-methoxy-6-polyprenyl-1,4-benzoquinol methylase